MRDVDAPETREAFEEDREVLSAAPGRSSGGNGFRKRSNGANEGNGKEEYFSVFAVRCLRPSISRPLTPPQESNILHTFEKPLCGLPHPGGRMRRQWFAVACQRCRFDWVRLGPGALVGHRQGRSTARALPGGAPKGAAAVAGGRRRDRRRRGERSGVARAREELSGRHPELRLSVRRVRRGRGAANAPPAVDAGDRDRAVRRAVRSRMRARCTASRSTPRARRPSGRTSTSGRRARTRQACSCASRLA